MREMGKNLLYFKIFHVSFRFTSLLMVNVVIYREKKSGWFVNWLFHCFSHVHRTHLHLWIKHREWNRKKKPSVQCFQFRHACRLFINTKICTKALCVLYCVHCTIWWRHVGWIASMKRVQSVCFEFATNGYCSWFRSLLYTTETMVAQHVRSLS